LSGPTDLARPFKLDLVREDSPPGWTVRGFSTKLEGGDETTWRVVEGRDLLVRFELPRETRVRVAYGYFSTTKNQVGLARLDDEVIGRHDARPSEAGDSAGGFAMRTLGAGAHELRFRFERVRGSDEVPGDARPLSAAFTALHVEEIATPSGVWGRSVEGLSLAALLGVILAALFWRLLWGRSTPRRA